MRAAAKPSAMFETADLSDLPTGEQWAALAAEIAAVTEGEPNVIANLANAAALIFHGLPGLNWAGFYLMEGDGLVLGPFQGRVACVRIPVGRGVCGAAAAMRTTQVVKDVHAFPGHIACDAASRSESVVPIVLGDGRLFGVLDLDSPEPGRFDEEDAAGAEEVVRVLVGVIGAA